MSLTMEPNGSESEAVVQHSTKISETEAVADPQQQLKAADANAPEIPKRDWRFWLVFLALDIGVFVYSLELTAVSTALPVIVNSLNGSQFVWVGSAYILAATAFVPLSGGLAQALGRRVTILGSFFFFILGSALCGAAPSLNFLIAGRTIQGLGGGGISSLTFIIIADLVPLHERGTFISILGIATAFASGIGPVVGGALAQQGQWRWLFYLNIPICGLSAGILMLFLNLRTPQGTLREKLGQMDWVGLLLVIGSTTACMIGLTWGGIQFPWQSAQVLVPLIIGFVGLVVFMLYETKLAKNPIITLSLASTLTGLSGYMQTFFSAVILLALTYYLPVYFQACKGASPTASGVDTFGIPYSSVPAGIMAGITVAKTGRYRPLLWAAWALVLIGMGLLSTLGADTARGKAIGYEIVVSFGIGILWTTTLFPVIAPLPVSANAFASALYIFVRYFAQVWGVTIGGTVLQSELRRRLPPQFDAAFPQGTAIAYAVIPLIAGFDGPLRDEVRAAFAGSLRVVWQVLIGVGAMGLLASLGMKHLVLHRVTDKDWGFEEKSPDPGGAQELAAPPASKEG